MKYTNFMGKQLRNSCNREYQIFKALCLNEFDYMGEDFQVWISIFLSKFISKFRILVCKNSKAISISFL